jgi:hypothetical protein
MRVGKSDATYLTLIEKRLKLGTMVSFLFRRSRLQNVQPLTVEGHCKER